MKGQSVSSLAAAAIAAVALLGSCADLNEVNTPLESAGTELDGMGVELDPHFISQNLTRSDGAKPEDWTDIVVRRCKMMDIQRFRCMVQPQWYEPVNDNSDPFSADPDGFTWDTIEMQSLYAVLDMAQEMGAEVVLTVWGCPAGTTLVDKSNPAVGKKYFNCSDTITNWVNAPKSNEEFAENFSVLVKHLIEVKGYTCVKEVTPFNEPDGNVCESGQYALIVKAMDERFRADGIRDKVRFNLSDNTDCRRFYLKETVENVGDKADLFNSHTYMCGYDTPNSYVLDWERENLKLAASVGKKHFVGEFGSNLCVGASRQTDINWYKRGVLIVRNAVNFLNAGASGASYWGLIDQYYNLDADYGAMQQLGLWRYKKVAYQPQDIEDFETDYQPRPQYYAYSLLTRFVRKGDFVFPLDLTNEYAAGAAILSPDGDWTYVFANGSGSDETFLLRNANAAKLEDCGVYEYSESTLPSDDSMIAPSGTVKASGKGYKVVLPSQTVLLLTTKK